MIVDEIGYLLVSLLFFQLINHRYEHASTVLTSNKGFEDWGTILGDEVMAAALIDRLMHHCHVVNIRVTATACESMQIWAWPCGHAQTPLLLRPP